MFGAVKQIRLMAIGCMCLGMLLASCSTTRMTSPRQLQSGEVVASVAIDEPGDFFIPRIDAQAQVGLGDAAAFSAHLGTSVFAFYGGLGVQLYPLDWFTLSLQGEAKGSIFEDIDDVEIASEVEVHGVLRPTFLFYKRDVGGFYGGPQATLTFFSKDNGHWLSSIGLFAGYEYLVAKGHGLQFEVSLLPVWIPLSGEHSRLETDAFAWFFGRGIQVGFAYNGYVFDAIEPTRTTNAPSK